MSGSETPSRVSDGTSVEIRDYRPLKSRYIVVVLLPVVVLGCLLVWGFGILFAVGAATEAFVRGPVPGEITVQAHPGTWYVYSEGGATITKIEVIGADGQALNVRPSAPGPGYDYGGSGGGVAVGEFDVQPGRMGSYRVVVSGSTDDFGNGSFAVGEFAVARFVTGQQAAMVTLLVVTVGSSLAIAIVPVIVRRRRLVRRS